MSALELIQSWKTQLVASPSGMENPAGFIEITDYDELVAGGSETTIVGGGGSDTCGVCCRGSNTCCCSSCTCG